MNVLLVYANRYRFMAPPPIGLATLVPPLTERGHQVRVLDLLFEKDPKKALERAISGQKPDLVGFSIRNVDEQDMSRESTALADARTLVQLAAGQGLHTVLGGAAFSTFPERMLEYMGAEVGIQGQAETILPRLLDGLGGTLDTTLPGLVWRDGERVRSNPPLLPGYAGVRPDWGSYDHRPYRRSMFQAAVVVRSGCAYRCSYCDVPHVFGPSFIRRDTESVLDDLARLRKDHGITLVFLNDPAFNAPLDQAKALLEDLIRARIPVMFSSTFVPVTGCHDAEFWSLYRRAGGIVAVFGVEALSDAAIEGLAKPFTLSDVFQSTAQATRAGVRVICTTMLGGPCESDASIDQACQTISRLDYAILTPGFGIRIMPHTPLAERARREGVIAADDDLFAPRFYVSPQMDLARARKKIGGTLRRYGWRATRMLPVGMRLMWARAFASA